MSLLQLRKHQKQKNLVSVQRDGIDDRSIQGFVLDVSDKLVAIQYVYDFHLDGLMFLQVEDITAVKHGKTNIFQKKLLQDEGLLQAVPFAQSFALESWQSLMTELSKTNKFMILEREALPEPDYFIGRILRVNKTCVTGLFFSGAANWLENPEKMMFEDLTCCQIKTNYINFYQRYFQRSDPKNF